MLSIKRTDSDDPDFKLMVKELDLDLKIRDGDEHEFYSQFNKTDKIKHVILMYDKDEPVGCGAIREYAPGIMEIKRMFVPVEKRGQGNATKILAALETWCTELNYKKCILETGKKQPEAIRLYESNKYKRIPNFGAYENMENSVCFEKELVV